METTTISVKDIPVPLWRRVRARAAELGISVPECLVELLTLALDGKKRAA